MIKIVDFEKEKQSICRAMICQLNSQEYQWEDRIGLKFLKPNEKIINKTIEFLNIAQQNSIDLLLFPELSIPENLIGKLKEWSHNHQAIIISGSHYHKNPEKIYISRCPVIVNGEIFYTEKITPSPFELSPIQGEGLNSGEVIYKFVNTSIGNFSMCICADYLDEKLKLDLDLDSLDILCVSAFQRDSQFYYRRMNTDCENSKNGLYILYSNFYDVHHADGNSAVFGLMDRIFSEKLLKSGYTDLKPEKKLIQFRNETEYTIVDFDLINKRPFLNRNLNTIPNLYVKSSNSRTTTKELQFIQKIAHDDERYKRIDELFVPPKEYPDILKILEASNFVFLVGDPGMGKTYTAVKILKEYFEKGYEPIWIAGLDKEERDIQSRALINFVPSANQIVYFEDPFGRIVFERRDSLFQIFTPLIERIKNLDCKILITSRKEVFEKFSQESLIEKDTLQFKKELSIKNPSYDDSALIDIFEKLASLHCEWYEKTEYSKLVKKAINEKKLTTPLAVRDLVYTTRNINSITEIEEQIEKRKKDNIKVFALELSNSSYTIKTILCLVFLCGTKGKVFLIELYQSVVKELTRNNLPIENISFNIEMRSQIGYRIEQFGLIKSAYKFSHPTYEEALASLIKTDRQCEIIINTILDVLILLDEKLLYKIIYKIEFKYPDISLMIFNHVLSKNKIIKDNSIKFALTKNLISIYNRTKNQEYFDLACKILPLDEAIKELNSCKSSWYDLTQIISVVARYFNNSPFEFDKASFDKIDWRNIFSQKIDEYFTPTRFLYFLNRCYSIDNAVISIFIEKKGINYIKKAYFLLEDNDRKKLYNLLKGLPIRKDLNEYKKIIDRIEKTKGESRIRLLRKVIFSEKIYYGKLIIDDGAAKAIKKPWSNLLPVGIAEVYGDFSSGSIVGVFSLKKELIAVGLTEYSSMELRKIKGYSSNYFQELIGYFHTSCAIRNFFFYKFFGNYSKGKFGWKEYHT